MAVMTKIIDGKAISMQIKEEIKKEAASLKEQGKNVTLAVIQVGDNPASCVYVRNKKKACAYIGVESDHMNFRKKLRKKN